MPESTKARIINDLIEESVYGPRGSETLPCANAWEVSKLIASLQARIEALEAAAKPNHPEKPDSSLVERVAAVIDNGTACDREHARIARDAIREVAAWMTSNPDHHFPPALVFALEQEAVKYHCATMITDWID
jgi:hypothetical protein